MFFQRVFDEPLAQASYMIGCQRTGEALIVDPNRDVQRYIDAARAESLRITHVTETHIHADFVSGSRELAQRTGARLLLSGEGGADWSYGFAAESGARLLHDGDAFMLGSIRIEALHTPGHTPEHLSFVVTDTMAGAGPWGILTGDFVFVGDVGRPDLLETAVGRAGTMEESARTLFRSLRRFRALPEHLQVYPGHGAGSACGKAIGAVPSTTVGYEKLANWGVAATDEAEFVRQVLDGQPEPPPYFSVMKRVNRDGPPLLGGRPSAPVLSADAIDDLLERNQLLVDTRGAAQFAEGHLPGALNLPLGASFATWAGWLLPYDRDLYLVVSGTSDQDSPVADAVRALAMIGLDRVAGVLGTDALSAWARTGGALVTVDRVAAREAASLLQRGDVAIVDVREPAEWRHAHLAGVLNVPLAHLEERVGELPPGTRLVVHCRTGPRSAIAASVVQRAGRLDVAVLEGGIEAWVRAGLPVDGASDEG